MSEQGGTQRRIDVPAGAFERGMYHSVGRGGRIDLVEAHKWFNIAAAAGDKLAARHRNELAGEMTRAELTAALRAAREWVTRH
jgi:TPR repeat protein